MTGHVQATPSEVLCRDAVVEYLQIPTKTLLLLVNNAAQIEVPYLCRNVSQGFLKVTLFS